MMVRAKPNAARKARFLKDESTTHDSPYLMLMLMAFYCLSARSRKCS